MRFKPNYISFAMADVTYRDLVVNIKSITMTDNQSTNILLSDEIPIFLDAMVSQIYLPEKTCLLFEKAFELVLDPITGRYLVNNTLHTQLLDQNASITFKIGTLDPKADGLSITLPYASFDLEVSHPIVENSTRYFPIRKAENDSQNTLGRNFFQEAYLIVDYERQNFSVSQSVFDPGARQNLVAIPSINITNSTNLTQPKSSRHHRHSSLSSGLISGNADLLYRKSIVPPLA